MEDVVKEAREIAGDFDMDLYIPEEEVQRRDIEEAVNRGYQEGIEKGLEQGIQQGIQQNRKEMIINMHNKNMDIKNISDILNISIENVENIITNSKNS